MAARLVIVVKRTPAKFGGIGWEVGTPTELRSRLAVWQERKDRAVTCGVTWCRAHADAGGLAQLRVYGPRGLQYERTYPRSSDPRASKG